MNRDEYFFVEQLDEVVRQPDVARAIEGYVARVQEHLQEHEELEEASLPVPVGTFGDQLPAVIASSRIVAYRAGTLARIERHPNSYQRVLCLQGLGEIITFEDGMRHAHMLVGRTGGSLAEKWASVAENVWHQPVACGPEWVVLAFHTATEQELIDEYK
ncbi:MAG TPA: hypothetical protein VFB12_15910 [Ktedonobacteraceae bacterium]|nr:hypothetical protein [Ktedonobacteraceae bacterium]